MSNLEELADQVLAIDSSKSRSDIIMDLEYTKSVETTVNRIFDGHFLNGTERDPSKSAFLILDSDDDIDDEGPQPIDSSPSLDPVPITLQDSFEELMFDSNSKSSTSNYNGAKSTNVDKPIQRRDVFDYNFSTPPPAESRDSFSIIEDDSQNDDDDEPLPSSAPSFLSLDDNIEPIPDNKEDEKSISIFGSHFDDVDDIVDGLPSTADFFDDLLTQKPPTPVIELDDDDDDDDGNDDIELISLEEKDKSTDRKGKRQAFDFDTPLESSRNNRRRLDVDVDVDMVEDFELLTTAERKEKEKEEKKRKREQLAEEKRQKKVEMLEEKQRLKVQKQLEKERKTLFEKENRIRADRNEILKEIIVDIHPDFLKTKPGQLLELVLVKKEAEVRDLLLIHPNPSFTLSWRRKTNSEWDQDSQAFIPLSNTRIVQEPVVLVYVDIPEFTKRIQNKTIDRYIDIIERDCDGRQIMLLIEGLEVYYKKKKLLKRRQFELQVRNSLNGTQAATNKKKKDLANVEDGLDPADVEECLNYLQLVRGIMLIPTKDDEDTASWIESLTTDLALGRYKSKNINNAYKVSKSGIDPKDTYFKMLQEIQLCTSPIAKSILNTYPTLQSLDRAYQQRNVAQGELLLADLEVERSVFRSRDRKINRVMSKKIYTIFNSDDPEQIIY